MPDERQPPSQDAAPAYEPSGALVDEIWFQTVEQTTDTCCGDPGDCAGCP